MPGFLCQWHVQRNEIRFSQQRFQRRILRAKRLFRPLVPAMAVIQDAHIKSGGPAGDLQILIAVRPHKLFKRNGYDLYIEIPVTFTQAALGSAIDVPTLEKPVRYDLPEGTQPGQVYRIKGQGVQMLNSTARGDLYITVKVEVPRKLNDKQKELLRRFEESTSGREYEEKKSFFERVKDAFNN